jgi:hypothetical protein
MLVRYLVSMSGSGFTREVGQIHDVDVDEAERLILAGFAQVAEGGGESRAAVIEKAKRGRKKSPETPVPAPVPAPETPVPDYDDDEDGGGGPDLSSL